MWPFILLIYLSFVSMAGIVHAISLEEVLRDAEAASPLLDRLEQTTTAADVSRWEARSRLGPSVTVSGSYLRNNEDVVLTLPTSEGGDPVESTITPLEQTTVRVTAALPIVDPASWLAIKQRKHVVTSVEEDARGARQEFRYAVASAYLDALLAQERFQVALQAAEMDRLRLELSQAREKEGKAARSVGLGAEADFLAADLQRTRTRVQLETAKQVLESYVGHILSGSFDLVQRPVSSDFSIEHHPDIAAAEARVDAAHADRSRTVMAFLPRLEGTFSYLRSEPAAFSNPEGESWSVGATASWTLLSGGMRVAQTQVASANERAARAMLEETRETLQRSIVQRAGVAHIAEAAIPGAEAKVKAMQRAADEARADYEEGKALLVDLRVAEVALQQAQLTLIEAKVEAARASLALDRLLGRL